MINCLDNKSSRTSKEKRVDLLKSPPHLMGQSLATNAYIKGKHIAFRKIQMAMLHIYILYTSQGLKVVNCNFNLYFFFKIIFSGERLGVWLALFPTVYLSAGTATALILIGGETMKLFFQIVCGPLCSSNPLSTVEWYLVFTSLCIVLSQLPNLNSIAGLSLIGAITAIFYSTMVWVLSVSQPRPPTISYEPLKSPSFSASVFSVLNALGIIAFAFRGHNLALEIQV